MIVFDFTLFVVIVFSSILCFKVLIEYCIVSFQLPSITPTEVLIKLLHFIATIFLLLYNIYTLIFLYKENILKFFN